MKSVSFILGFFLLFMACLPCGDSIECNTKAPVEISATDNQKQHTHNSEVCSPFCICSCCATSTYYSAFSKPQVSKILIQSEKFLLYNVVFNTEAHYSIWQPPQLS